MFNTKAIACAAAIGCLLSFLSGLLFKVPFGIVCLRALFSAVLGGAAGFLIAFIWDKFLAYTGETVPLQTAAPGNSLDITIGDESLPEDRGGPSFHVDVSASSAVSEKKEAASAPPPAAAVPAAEKMPENSGRETAAAERSVPVQNKPPLPSENGNPASGDTETEAGDSKNEAAPAANTEKNTSAPPQTAKTDVDGLDSLPDMNNLLSSMQLDSEEDEDSEEQTPEIRSSAYSDTSVQDTGLMAQAIRTILSKDN
ncbi:MAG: hypothetical protein NC041_05060 [Bacteroides sp.]|nr:hypothetical protein [Prevotella sp.]MCM1407327.1 hypothetical protein [Treponema brennaborense]MCM1469817.1 hypothetical protein [Bacteroides sp.]